MASLPSSDSDTPVEIPRSAPTRTLEKGLFLLGLFDVDNPEWSLKELRERAGLPKATTRRLDTDRRARDPRDLQNSRRLTLFFSSIIETPSF